MVMSTPGVAVIRYIKSNFPIASIGDASNDDSAKIQAERALRQLLPAQTTILRLPLVLGAGDTGFMCPALRGLRQAGRVILIGSGQAPWTVLAASDAARAIALCLNKPETRGTTYNVVGETITNGELLRAIGAGAGCTKDIRLPYAIAWMVAALTELVGHDGLTRAQVTALSQPLSMKGDRFARLGFAAQTGWRDALAEGVAWCAERSGGCQ